MIGVLKSSAVGAATAILTWPVAFLLLVALAGVNDAQSHAVRQTIAIVGLAVVAAGGVFILVKIPFAFGLRFRADPWLALVAAGVVTGLMSYWLLLYLSIMNDCMAGVSVPYGWVAPCSHSA